MILIVVVLSWRGCQVVGFHSEVGSHLDVVKTANQPSMAIGELDQALLGMDLRGLGCGPRGEQIVGQCFTSVMVSTADEDVGLWRRNLEEARADLARLPSDASHLEVSNTLMKLRESITTPEGVAIYGWNKFVAVLLSGLFAGLAASFVVWVREQ